MKRLFLILLSVLPLVAGAQRVVNVEHPGDLTAMVDAENLLEETNLVVKGALNGSDLRSLRMLCGGTLVTSYYGGSDIKVFTGKVEVLDLSEATIVSGGDFYHNVYPAMSSLTFMYSEDDVLGDCLFESCEQLRQVVLPHQLKAIGRWCFFGTHLEDVDVPNGVERIMNRAFSTISSLKEVRLPYTLESVEAYAFSGCNNLATLRIWSMLPPAYGFKSFDASTLAQCELQVSGSYLNNYLEAAGWNAFNTIVNIQATDAVSSTAMNEDDTSEVISDLQGRGLSGKPAHGVYIQDGRKRVVR